jgi:hypothetical protein
MVESPPLPLNLFPKIALRAVLQGNQPSRTEKRPLAA